MIRTVRMNAYTTADRAQEEANGLTLAFARSPLAARPSFAITVTPFCGEFHVNITADVDTTTEGFLSIIIARTLAGHCRAPVQRLAFATQTISTGRIGTARPTITQRAIAARPRLPR
jgi:hypothetical protein